MNQSLHNEIRAVIFDLDNVLFHYNLDLRVRELERVCGIPAAEIKEKVFLSEFEEDADRGRYNLEEYLDGVNRILGTRLDFPVMAMARKASMTPIMEMIDLAWILKDRVKLALLTNNGAFLKQALPDIFPEAPRLFGEHACFSGDFNCSKPDPRIFHLVCDRLEVKPEETIFIDDQADYIEGGITAGLHCHRFQDLDSLKTYLREFDLP